MRARGVVVLASALVVLLGVDAHAQERAAAPFTVAYYYRVKWGHQQEFERLFLKNHQPILMAEKEAGRIKGVSLYRPRFHGDGRADWTFLVVIQFASWAAFGEPSREAEISRRLFPDQDTFKKEEQRRFEILDAHWDVPLEPVPPAP
jgi:hypothetical protein